MIYYISNATLKSFNLYKYLVVKIKVYKKKLKNHVNNKLLISFINFLLSKGSQTFILHLFSIFKYSELKIHQHLIDYKYLKKGKNKSFTSLVIVIKYLVKKV